MKEKQIETSLYAVDLPLASSLSPWAPPSGCRCIQSASEPAASGPPALQPVGHCTPPTANMLHPPSSTACLLHPCLDLCKSGVFSFFMCKTFNSAFNQSFCTILCIYYILFFGILYFVLYGSTCIFFLSCTYTIYIQIIFNSYYNVDRRDICWQHFILNVCIILFIIYFSLSYLTYLIFP